MVDMVNNGTEGMDPGNAANCRGAFDYVAPTISAARATLSRLGKHQKFLSKLGYSFELNDSA